MLEQHHRDFLLELHRIGAIQVDTKGGFKLALHRENPNAPRSPYYFNLRKKPNGNLTNKHIETIAEANLAAARKANIEFTHVAGIPRAGTPIAQAMVRINNRTEKTKLTYVGMRKIVLNSGRESFYIPPEFKITAGFPKLLLADDLITHAKTKRKAIHVAGFSCFDVTGIAVYLDREEGGRIELNEEGVLVAYSVTTTQAFDLLTDEGVITHADADSIKMYRGLK